MKKWYLCFLLLLALGANAAIKTITPHLGAIQASFSEPAKTRLAHLYDINMPISGQLERINLREGSIVNKGQVLVRMEQQPLVQALEQARARIATYRAWHLLQQKTLVRREELGKNHYINQEEIDKARAYTKMLAAEIKEAAASLAIAKYNLAQSIMHAPINGTVLHRYSEGGQWLAVGTPLLQIGALNKLEVIVDVLTQEAQQLSIGDTVLLTSVASPLVLNGKVKRIYPAGFTKKSALGVDEQRVNVIVSLNDTKSAHLGVGYRLQAEFLVGSQNKNALIIPRFSVLQDNNGSFYVFVVKDKKLYKKIVKIGIKTDSEVSIIKGLTIRDTIVAAPTADMHDGIGI